MSEQPKPTLSEAASTLYDHFKCGDGVHPYITSIGVADHTGTIFVYLARKVRGHERKIPAEWEGWPIETKVIGRMRLG